MRTLWIALFLLMLVLNGAAFAAHLQNNTVGSGVTGIQVLPDAEPGHRVRVVAEGPAAALGIQDQEILVAIGGLPVPPDMPYQEVNRLLHGEIGDSLTVTMQGADGTIQDYAVTLEEEHQVWRRFRLPLGRAGIYFPILEAVLLAVYLLTAFLIFWRRSDDWMALFLSATLMLITPQLSYSWYFLYQDYGEWNFWIGLLVTVGVAFTLPNFYLLPDGQFVPRWSVLLATGWVVWSLATELFPLAPFSIYGWSGIAQLLVWLGWFATGMLAQIYRYRYVADPEERQQIKWLSFGLTLAVLVNIGWTLTFEIFPALNQPGTANLLIWLVGRTIYVLGMMMLPISFGIAVFRYRLWDIDNLINRTLVYGALTTIVVAIYVVVVTVLDSFFETSSAFSQIVAITLDLILFEPLRERLQAAADKLMFGEREDAPAVAERLGQRLRTATGPDAELPAIVETLAETLKLPYVAIAIAEGESQQIAASFGEPVATSAAFTWPLVYQNRLVGQLILAPRTLGEALKPADWELVERVALQASVTAHYTSLINELKHAQKITPP